MLRNVFMLILFASFVTHSLVYANPDAIVIPDGDLRIKGVGSGLVFPDGSIQYKATSQVILSSIKLAVGDSVCPNGGVLVQTGIDANGNGILDSSEVTNSQSICNGAVGAAGATGAAGAAGATGPTGAPVTTSGSSNVFTTSLISGRTFGFTNNSNIPILNSITFNSDGTVNGDTFGVVWSGNGKWSINNSGQLVFSTGTAASNGEIDTVTMISYTPTAINTIYSSNTMVATDTYTFYTGFATAMLDGMSFTTNNGVDTVTFNNNGTWVDVSGNASSGPNNTWTTNATGQLVMNNTLYGTATYTIVSGNTTAGWTSSQTYTNGTTSMATWVPATGGGSVSVPIVFGTVSVGTAIASGQTVNLKDANGITAITTVNSTGQFSLPVNGLTAPYTLNSGGIYSFAISPGITDINPFTNLSLVLALGTSVINQSTIIPANFYSTFNTIANSLKAATNGLYPLSLPITQTDFLSGAILHGFGVDKVCGSLSINMPDVTGNFSASLGGAQILSGVKSSNGSVTITPNAAAIASISGIFWNASVN